MPTVNQNQHDVVTFDMSSLSKWRIKQITSYFRRLRTQSVFGIALAISFMFASEARGQQLTGAIPSEATPSLSPPLAEIKPKRLEFKGVREQFEVKKLPPLPESKGEMENKTLQSKSTAAPQYESVKSFRGLGSSDNKAISRRPIRLAPLETLNTCSG